MKIFDTTLRDGEQMPGVVFNPEQKIELAKLAVDFGVDFIDIMPAVSKSEKEVTEYLVEEGLKNKLIASTLLRKEHIELAKKMDLENIVLFTSMSDIHLEKKLGISRYENLKKSKEAAEYAKGMGLRVSFAGEDSSRADMSYLIYFINEINADYFFPCDTLGILTPRKTYDFIKKIKEETSCKIGLHVHNDFGQATANTLAGFEAGADLFSGTFNGIGERAGNAPIEEVVVALKHQYRKELPLKYGLLGEICNKVEKYSEVSLQAHKPVSGKNAFAHESGIHVDGVIKHSRNYEAFDPELIGRKREFLFGKHSGKNGLRYLFGDKFDEEEYGEMLEEIKLNSEKQKRAFSEQEVLLMYGRE